MKTITLSSYAPVIMVANMPKINVDIATILNSDNAVVLDFDGVHAIQVEAAREMLQPLRSRYGSTYRRNVQFKNVNRIVNNTLVYSGI